MGRRFQFHAVGDPNEAEIAAAHLEIEKELQPKLEILDFNFPAQGSIDWYPGEKDPNIKHPMYKMEISLTASTLEQTVKVLKWIKGNESVKWV